jgi:hypothetical protein
MVAQGRQVTGITLYMPEAVVAIQAESAKKQFIKYEPTEEEKSKSLTIIAHDCAGYRGTCGRVVPRAAEMR